MPADLYLLKSRISFVQQVHLNGESSPVEKLSDKKPKENDNYLDYPNILYERRNS